MEYVFDGSDDDLEMGGMEVRNSDFLDGDGEETNVSVREKDGDGMEESDGGNTESESMGDYGDGEGDSTDDEGSEDDVRSGRRHRGGVVSRYGVVWRD